MYEITLSVEQVIRDCKDYGKGILIKRDKDGNVLYHLRSEWVPHRDGVHDVIVVYFCNPLNGSVVYEIYVEETKEL